MAKAGNFFNSKAFKIAMARIYGIGAGVVILGAMFKILHLPFAGLMLGVGLTTEALIFFISAFEPVREDPDWTLVYPELAGMDARKEAKDAKGKSLTSELDKMLDEARIEQDTINKLGDGLKSLSENVSRMSNVSDAALATDTYTQRVNEAADSIQKVNSSYSRAIEAINSLGDTGDASKEYNSQVTAVTQKLAQLNQVYEMELQESNKHIQAMGNFYGSLGKTIENLSDSEDTASHLKTEIHKLNKNLSSLNAVYGNMLSAMAPPRSE
ncbi:MAG: gliding motility protein GldL [Bacteroidia bacterium]